jgi:cyclic pyranopterin phosphate synthase
LPLIARRGANPHVVAALSTLADRHVDEGARVRRDAQISPGRLTMRSIDKAAPMTEKVIPLADHRYLNQVPVVPSQLEAPTGFVADALARPLRDLRISVTDRCNFRCVYCMPKEVFDKEYAFLPHGSLLTFEEITRIAKIAIAHGVEKIRLTGGEPLLRKHIEKLIETLAALKTPDGRALDLTLTTNASLLARKAQALKDAGLKRVTVSLDALDDATFKRMNDVDFPVSQVLEGIDAAHRVGLGPIKINMVVKGGMNDREIVPMARHFRNSPFILRFIEYMDVGASNGWRMDEVIPSQEVVRRINAVMPLEPVAANYESETASRWRYRDGGGEIGMISSVTQAFCHACTRARLSTEGKLYTCLFATGGHDLRALLRGGHSDEEISTVIAHLWRARSDRYSEIRASRTGELQQRERKVEMSYIGG